MSWVGPAGVEAEGEQGGLLVGVPGAEAVQMDRGPESGSHAAWSRRDGGDSTSEDSGWLLHSFGGNFVLSALVGMGGNGLPWVVYTLLRRSYSSGTFRFSFVGRAVGIWLLLVYPVLLVYR